VLEANNCVEDIEKFCKLITVYLLYTYIFNKLIASCPVCFGVHLLYLHDESTKKSAFRRILQAGDKACDETRLSRQYIASLSYPDAAAAASGLQMNGCIRA
jgi:hypothetical protein